MTRSDVPIHQLRMLATDIARSLIEGASPAVEERLMSYQPQHLCISSMTRAELSYRRIELGDSKWASRITEFLNIINTAPWDSVAADKYAELCFGVRQRGIEPGDKDVGIAAHSLAIGAILVTGLPDTFSAICDGLKLENWSDE